MSIQEKYNKILPEFRAEISVNLKEDLQKIFKKYPKCESFTLVAYVDYFNDGDTCNFHYAEYYSKLNERNFYPDMFRDGNTPCRFNSVCDKNYFEKNPWIKDAVKEFWNVFYDIPTDLIQQIYGDHIAVQFNRDGSTINKEFTDHD